MVPQERDLGEEDLEPQLDWGMVCVAVLATVVACAALILFCSVMVVAINSRVGLP